MQGHGFDGEALPDVPTGSVIVGSGGLYSTPNDLLNWMQWHQDQFILKTKLCFTHKGAVIIIKM